jgi:hypothetical protein
MEEIKKVESINLTLEELANYQLKIMAKEQEKENFKIIMKYIKINKIGKE